MRKILKVAQREFAETVKTKTFLLGLLMIPILIGLIVYFGGRLSTQRTGPRPVRYVAVTDLSNELSADLTAAFERHNAAHPDRQIVLELAPVEQDRLEAVEQTQKDRVRSGQLLIYVVVDSDAVEGRGKMRFYTRGTSAAEVDAQAAVENLLQRAVVNRRCALHHLSPEVIADLQRRVAIEQIDLGPSQRETRVKNEGQRMAAMMVPFFFMFMMWMGIFGLGQHMVMSVIEEKSSRVIEVLLSAVTPFQLMAGKIVGLAGIGLSMIVLWTGAAYAAARWQGVTVAVRPDLLVFFGIYYVLGFLLFTSILAGAGAVCNTIKESQGLVAPMTIFMVVPMVAWYNLASNPNGALARVLSFVPPMTPIVMILRLAAGSRVPILETLASLVLLAASVPAVVWAAAKVFRTGILLYGKRPGLREVFHWLGQR